MKYIKDGKSVPEKKGCGKTINEYDSRDDFRYSWNCGDNGELCIDCVKKMRVKNNG